MIHWEISPRSRQVLVDWRNGLGTWTRLEWSTVAQPTARGVRYDVELRRVAGAELPADAMDRILAELHRIHLPIAERSAS